MKEWGRPYQKRKETTFRNGRLVSLNRNAWLPPDYRRIGIGYDDTTGNPRAVYFLERGEYQLISLDIVSFLTIPEERVFHTRQEEVFFCLFNRRCWYLFVDKEGIFHARYSR